MVTYYLWFKALHVIAVIAWMAGMLYLPRLYVYHAGEAGGSAASETFKLMERRLLRAIMNPAMIGAWIFGLLMLWTGWRNGFFDLTQGWLHVKLALVMAMTALHMVYAGWRKDFEADRNHRSPRFYRIWNEVPTVLLILVVIMVVVKPF